MPSTLLFSTTPVQDRIGFWIGAWGSLFFESDHDYNIVSHLDADCGLYRASGKRDSFYLPHESDKLRNLLEKDGWLSRLFNKSYGMLENYRVIDIKKTKYMEGYMLDSPRYYLFLLGLLAMQLGCMLSRKFPGWMKSEWKACIFTYEKVGQAQYAVSTFENGKPLGLGSLTLNEKQTLGIGFSRTMYGRKMTSSNVPADEYIIPGIRMLRDDEFAKFQGGTGTQGVDISRLSHVVDDTQGLSLEFNPVEKETNIHSEENAKWFSVDSRGDQGHRIADHDRVRLMTNK